VPALWAAARYHPEAKNAAQAGRFSAETRRLLAWMADYPPLAAEYAGDQRRIRGGAYRLSARYLLDGGQPGAALGEYLRALVYTPGFALRHWHRMVYALLSLAGLSQTSRWYRQLSVPPDLSAYPQLDGWPGLSLASN
jgi:hypothetical protein